MQVNLATTTRKNLENQTKTTGKCAGNGNKNKSWWQYLNNMSQPNLKWTCSLSRSMRKTTKVPGPQSTITTGAFTFPLILKLSLHCYFIYLCLSGETSTGKLKGEVFCVEPHLLFLVQSHLQVNREHLNRVLQTPLLNSNQRHKSLLNILLHHELKISCGLEEFGMWHSPAEQIETSGDRPLGSA